MKKLSSVMLGDARYFAKKEGFEEGREEGKMLGKEETVKILYNLSLSIEKIAEATSLDSAIVERIIKELSSNK